jgi:hypothetical protein
VVSPSANLGPIKYKMGKLVGVGVLLVVLVGVFVGVLLGVIVLV